MDVEEKRKELYQKYGIDKIEKLAMHDDADGLTSGVLLTFAFKTGEVTCPEDFGDWPIVPDPTKNLKVPDACCDMIPKNPEWTGVCIDHHPGHPEPDKRKYKLIWGEVPATLMVYRLFKDIIPKEHRWKVAVGLVGDGQPELIPSEVWKDYPFLLENYTRAFVTKWGKTEFSQFPIFMRLSSNINAACKIPDKWYVAYQVLKACKDPMQILEDPALLTAKDMIERETKRVQAEHHAIDLSAHFRVWKIETEYRIERTLAWISEEASHKTTLVINDKTKRMSMRGPLSEFYCEELAKVGYSVHGHPGFAGGKLTNGQDFMSLYNELRKIRI